MTKENTQFAILGLLTSGCNTGYSIKQMMDGSLTHFWKISYGQIYPILKGLVDQGYASVRETSQEGKPDKKEYQITDMGRDALRKWLEHPIKELETTKNELLLKLFFSRHQESQVTIRHILQYQQKLEDRYHTYHTIKNNISARHMSQADALYWIITLDYGLATTKAAIGWCGETISKLKGE
ncbi:PadR family transcriptional regulator [Bacillus haimaensis]|uniref:PadR family transcriptional regulator n=1 Tax=Bacillus haimaensis TaxID=3160967 RepID=UPI003AA93AA5